MGFWKLEFEGGAEWSVAADNIPYHEQDNTQTAAFLVTWHATRWLDGTLEMGQ